MNIEMFSLDRFRVLQQMRANHFWYAGRQKMIANALDKAAISGVDAALDVGCGPGAQLPLWREYASHVFGLDQYAKQVDQDVFGHGVTLVAGDVSELPFEDASFDLVLALDVLEHVPEAPILSEAMRVLKPGGTLLVTVPAFAFLWSFRDDDAGHLRRYTKASMNATITRAGFEVKRMRYYQFLLFPIVALSRVFGRKTKSTRDMEDSPPHVLNGIFKALNLCEAWLDRLGVSMPVGSSIIMTAKKP